MNAALAAKNKEIADAAKQAQKDKADAQSAAQKAADRQAIIDAMNANAAQKSADLAAIALDKQNNAKNQETLSQRESARVVAAIAQQKINYDPAHIRQDAIDKAASDLAISLQVGTDGLTNVQRQQKAADLVTVQNAASAFRAQIFAKSNLLAAASISALIH